MLAIERRSEILDILRRDQSVHVSELSKIFRVTEETIRRDLDKLEQDGHAKKTYGGAVYRQNLNLDLPFDIRERTNKDEKNIIAKKIAQTIDDGESLIMDSSSTVLAVARALKQKKNLTIITNSVEILLEYANLQSFNVISTGGSLRERSLSLVGSNAMRSLSCYFADKAIISCKGADIERGISDSSEFEAEMKKVMITRARQTVLAVDGSKLNKVSFVRIADLNKINVLATEAALDEAWTGFIKNSGVINI